MNEFLFFLFFVDDIITMYRPENRYQATSFMESLGETFDVKDMGELKWFLGVRVIRDRPNRKLWLCQDSYVDKITRRFNLEFDKSPKTPMSTEAFEKNPNIASPQEIHLYQQKVGSLLYATIITRPDVARTANKLSEYLTNPSKTHFAAVDRAIAYLYGT